MFYVALLCLSAATNAAEISGNQTQWHPLTIDFTGPYAKETDDSPNPFLDYRLVLELRSPSGNTISVPGFFAGDGKGGSQGSTWRVRFAPEEAGNWSYRANFRQAAELAIDLDYAKGSPAAFHGESGNVQIKSLDTEASGFLKWGHLDYVGEHYLKFRNGPYWIKTGTDSPENFLAYNGFDGTTDLGGGVKNFLHRYEPHRNDVRPDDPFFVSRDNGADSRGIIGALNYLSDSGVNSIYFLPMNLGGDGYDTHPFTAPIKNRYFKTHFDLGKLQQWNTVLAHAQRRGIALNIVLNETELENREWQDNGQFGLERKLYYREMMARFGYLLAAKWNICEENNFTIDFVKEAAGYLSALDWNDKPISVHTPPSRFDNYYELLQNPLITATSIQYQVDKAGEFTETWRELSRNAGVPWVIDMDENETGLLDRNADDLRRRVLYDVLFSGGNIEWYFGFGGLPLGGDITVEDFRTRSAMWSYASTARKFMQAHLPFHRMQPMDKAVFNESLDFGGAEVFAVAGETYAIYLPNASGQPLLTTNASQPANWKIRWFNPLTGVFQKEDIKSVTDTLELGTPPERKFSDWVVLVNRLDTNEIEASNPGPAAQSNISSTTAAVLSNANDTNDTNDTNGEALAIRGVRNLRFRAGQLIELTLTAISQNNAVPSMFLSDAPDSASFDDNGDGSRTFRWQTQPDQRGSETISVTATDAFDQSIRINRSFSIAFEDNAESPTSGSASLPSSTQDGNQHPVLLVPSQIDISLGQRLELRIAPTDPDGPVPGVKLINAPQGVTLPDAGNGTRMLRWLPDQQRQGIYTVTLRVTDAVDERIAINKQIRVQVR